MGHQDRADQAAQKDRQPSDMHRQRRGRNLALAAVLFGMVALFYIVAIVKMGGN